MHQMAPSAGMSTWRGVMSEGPWQPPTNSRTPPPWSPDMAWQYPLHMYARDLIMWSLATDLPVAQQGPAAVLQLGGTARTLAAEMEHSVLVQGETADWGDGPALQPGLYVLLRRLAQRFGELDTETLLRTLMEFMCYRRGAREDIDQAITRFDILHNRAHNHAHFQASPAVLAFLLLMNLGISPRQLPTLFLTWGGEFPTTDDQITRMKATIRQNAHMIENHPNNPSLWGARPAGTFYEQLDDETNYGYFGQAASTSSDGWAWPAGVVPQSHEAAYFQDSAEVSGTCEKCGECLGYLESEAHFDTDTEEDDSEQPDAELEALLATEGPARVGEILYENYIFHKRRWRSFAARRTRRTRFKGRKGQGKGAKNAFSDRKGQPGKGLAPFAPRLR